jgi:hypothetical protein
MRDPFHITIGNTEFVVNQLPILKAAYLDKTVVSLVLPSLGGLEGFSPETEIKMDKLFKAFSEGLEKLTEEKLNKFLVDLFSCVQAIKSGQAPQTLNASNLNEFFSGNLFDLYKVAFEVMRHNRFAPFAMVEGGKGMEIINGFIGRKPQQKSSPNMSEKSESSPGNSSMNGPFGS